MLHGAQTDLTITGDEGWFVAVHGDYLFVDNGTCPCPTGLKVYDLSTGKRIIDETYMDWPNPPILRGGRWLTYDEVVDDSSPLPDCPEADKWEKDFGTGYEEVVVVDLQTLRKVRSGKIRCSPRQ